MIASMNTSRNEGINRVAVIDDEVAQAELTSYKLEEAGFEPIIIEASNPFATHEELTIAVRETEAQGLVCDHRLRRHRFSQFNGASYVASLYGALPSILTTQYIEIDVDVSIREFREKIPVLLSRDDTVPKMLVQAFRIVIDELSGKISSQRKAHRAVVRVTELSSVADERVVEAFIPQWNPGRAVRFPFKLIPEEIRDSVNPGVRLLSSVNIEAKSSDDLYFSGFELAPNPDPEDGLG